RPSERGTTKYSPGEPAASLAGILHVYVAFDWGDEIDLEQARALVPASFLELSRRRRTPSSFSFRPPPLHMALTPTPLDLAELGRVEAQAGLTVFDFAGVSLALRVPLPMAADALMRLCGSLADPTELVQAARTLLRPIFNTLRPAIDDAAWDVDFSEEYFVFQLSPEAHQVCGQPPWLAGMVHLESGPLSAEEV